MSSRKSKRKHKIPKRFEDTVCGLKVNKAVPNGSMCRDEDNSEADDAVIVEEAVSGDCGDNANEKMEGIAQGVGMKDGGAGMGVGNKEGKSSDSMIDKGSSGEEMDGTVQNAESTVSPTPTTTNLIASSIKSPMMPNVNQNVNHASYANVTKEVNEVNNKLNYIPTELIGEDREVVIFDEELVALGSKKWCLTLCGYFVGYKMSLNELIYNLRRMWSRHGVSEILPHSDGVFLFKFSHEEGLQYVLENGPWLINNKPMFVQKWEPDICLDKVEPAKLPLWIKFFNVPMEAWTDKGLSAIASRLGKPIIMDAMTANVCKFGRGKIGYARILVEIDAKKALLDNIELVYRGKDLEVKGSKFVSVEYTWKPEICQHCCVFGHNFAKCQKRSRSVEETTQEVNKLNQKDVGNGNEGFTNVQNKKHVNPNKPNATKKAGNNNNGGNDGQSRASRPYMMDKGGNKDGFNKQQPKNGTGNNGKHSGPEATNGAAKFQGQHQKVWSVKNNAVGDQRNSNRYSALSDQEDENSKQ